MTRQLGPIALIVAMVAMMGDGSALDLPQRKSGLWDIKISRASANRPAQTIQMCIDQKTDNMAQQMEASTLPGGRSDRSRSRVGAALVPVTTATRSRDPFLARISSLPSIHWSIVARSIPIPFSSCGNPS